ncbi:uncharacterized protein si:ch211-176l24.4 isoform X2 [Hoplias malabaricus]
MTSQEILKCVLTEDTLEECKKCKKKKEKKSKKRNKLKKNKKDKNVQQWLGDDCIDSVSCTQVAKVKKRKKPNEIGDDKKFPELLTEQKKLLKRKKHSVSKGQALKKSVDQPVPAEHVPMMLTLEEFHKNSTLIKEVQHKRRVMFNLSPEEFQLISQQHPSTRRAQFSTDRVPSTNNAVSRCESHKKPLVEENVWESQSTDDINSQDLFITQKFFSDPYADISSSPNMIAAVPLYQEQPPKTSHKKLSSKQTAEASAQTENFFTSPRLATALEFLHQSKASMCSEEPMDLSLPYRSRQEVALHQWNAKPAEGHSYPELKTENIPSGDESDISKGKADLSQLRVVQTLLNESFFFKMKGGEDPPKPASPLMFVTGSTDKK